MAKTKQEKANYGKTDRITSLTLKRNPLYYNEKPNISEIKFLFFDNEEDLSKAAKKGKINGLSLNHFKDFGKKWQNYYLSLPRYFAVFFNSEKNTAIALSFGIIFSAFSLVNSFSLNLFQSFEYLIIIHSGICFVMYSPHKSFTYIINYSL